MQLPEAVLAFKLLDGAGLTESQRQLALTACTDLSFESMKQALRRIFTGVTTENDTTDKAVKMEHEVLYGKHNKFVSSQRGSDSRPKVKPNYDHDKKGNDKRLNPVNRYGNRMKCRICQSIYHFAKDCPEAVHVNVNQTEEHVEVGNITLLTVNQTFVAETYGTAVIDTACTKTVCGRDWMNKFIDMGGQVLSSVESNRPFKFGHGPVVNAVKMITIGGKIGKTKCNIETEVVPLDLPLLLSKESLKRAGTELNIPCDEAIMFGEKINLELTSSGHYCVNILDDQDSESVNGNEVLYSINTFQDLDEPEKRKRMLLTSV